MTRTVSIGAKVKQLAGMLDTQDLSDWENRFVRSIVQRSNAGADTTHLTDAQVERLDELWQKHFA